MGAERLEASFSLVAGTIIPSAEVQPHDSFPRLLLLFLGEAHLAILELEELFLLLPFLPEFLFSQFLEAANQESITVLAQTAPDTSQLFTQQKLQMTNFFLAQAFNCVGVSCTAHSSSAVELL